MELFSDDVTPIPEVGVSDNISPVLGETVVIRDFSQSTVSVIGVTAQGLFHTDHGLCEPGELGNYILRLVGHPKAKREEDDS